MITTRPCADRRSGTSSPHHPACRDTAGDGCRAGGGFLIKLVSSDEVDGQRDLHTIFLRFGHQVLDYAGPLPIVQGGTDLRGIKEMSTQ